MQLMHLMLSPIVFDISKYDGRMRRLQISAKLCDISLLRKKSANGFLMLMCFLDAIWLFGVLLHADEKQITASTSE